MFKVTDDSDLKVLRRNKIQHWTLHRSETMVFLLACLTLPICDDQTNKSVFFPKQTPTFRYLTKDIVGLLHVNLSNLALAFPASKVVSEGAYRGLI